MFVDQYETLRGASLMINKKTYYFNAFNKNVLSESKGSLNANDLSTAVATVLDIDERKETVEKQIACMKHIGP